jgi:hypothetical protein
VELQVAKAVSCGSAHAIKSIEHENKCPETMVHVISHSPLGAAAILIITEPVYDRSTPLDITPAQMIVVAA